MRRWIVFTLIAAFVLCSVALADDKAEQILESVDKQANQYFDMEYTLTMTVTDAGGNKSVHTLRGYQKGPMRMYQFLEPASSRGMGFLSLDDQNSWVYLPETHKERRVAGHSRNQSFMGTDFAYDDMSITHYNKVYKPSLMSENETSYILELTPRPDQAVGYSKLVVTVDKAKNYICNIEFYNKKGEKEKTQEFTNLYKVDYKGKDGSPMFQWVPGLIIMTTLKDNHKTEAAMTNIKFNTGLSDDKFTVRQLKRME